MTVDAMSSLRDSLVASNDYYKYMLSLLPAQLITPAITSEEELSVEEEEEDEEEEDFEPAHNGSAKKNSLARRDDELMEVDKEEEDEDAEEEDDLATKLKRKLEDMRAKRCKPGTSDKREQQRLKRKLSKAKLKKKRMNEKLAAKTATVGGEKKPSANGQSSKPLTKPIFNKDGKVVFSKFDFSESGSLSLVGAGKTAEGERKKRKVDVPTGKNYKILIDKVSKQKEKISSLEKVDKEKATQLKEKLRWKSVLSKAEGIKVKDDVDLLKKSLKKKEKRSQKSSKDWARRESAIEKKKKAIIDKRKLNLAKRRDTKKEKTDKRNKKRGRGLIPGF